MNMAARQIRSEEYLDQLLEGFADAPPIAIEDIALDSRQLGPGGLFIACQGARVHGLDFAKQALKAGSVAIVYDASTATAVPESFDLPLIAVPELASKLGIIANRFFAEPSQALDVIGVTGTNGKSTVAWMLAQSLEALGRRCGYTGTLGFGLGRLESNSDMTSPDVIELHRRLAAFRDQGGDYAAIEVSSHALDQGRVDGVRFDAALFTNLSRDHLDYHGDILAYGEAKAKLFTEYPARFRIINVDSEFGATLATRCGDNVITVSTKFDRVANGRPYVFVRSVTAQSDGSRIRLDSSWGETNLFVPLPGDFNVANAVLACAYLLAIGVDIEDAREVLAAIGAPPGRMQRVLADRGPAVYVDYAHSPGALDVTLRALRTHCRGTLWCVFGCGGDRDAGKRPLMGRIATRLADRLVITSDNPRGEAPGDIIDGIIEGIANRARATVIEDRAAAIAWAIGNAGPADTILIAGKGHETYQIVGDRRLDFSDYGAALGNLKALGLEGDA